MFNCVFTAVLVCCGYNLHKLLISLSRTTNNCSFDQIHTSHKKILFMNFCCIHIYLMRSVFWNYFQVQWCMGQLWLFNGPFSVTALQSLFNMRRPVACVNLWFAQFAPTQHMATSHNHATPNLQQCLVIHNAQFNTFPSKTCCIVLRTWFGHFAVPPIYFSDSFARRREASQWKICDIEICE